MQGKSLSHQRRRAIPKQGRDSTPAADVNRDPNGRTVRVGCLVEAEGPVLGRVVYARDGAVVYRPIGHHAPSPHQPLQVAFASQIAVVEDPTDAVPGLSGECLRVACSLQSLSMDLRSLHGRLEDAGGDGVEPVEEARDAVDSAAGRLWDAAQDALMNKDPRQLRPPTLEGMAPTSPEKMLFEAVNGLPIPRIRGEAGTPAKADGKKYFDLRGASRRFKMREPILVELFRRFDEGRRVADVGPSSADPRATTMPNHRGHVLMPDVVCRPGDFATRIVGTCMEPVWRDGDWVIASPIWPTEDRFVNGHAYVIFLQDGRQMLKRAWYNPRRPSRLTLGCFNTVTHPNSWTIPMDSVRYVGKAIFRVSAPDQVEGPPPPPRAVASIDSATGAVAIAV